MATLKARRARPRRTEAPNLFVYGSLMHPKYWRAIVGVRASSSLRIKAARLRGWRRCWNGVRPSYGGAVLNLRKDPQGALWGGVVTGLTEENWARLDEQERSHLPRTRILVVTARGRRMWAYCYRQRVRGSERIPAAGYVAAVRAGAKALGSVVSRDVEGDVRRLLLLASMGPPTARGRGSSRAMRDRRGSTTRQSIARRG